MFIILVKVLVISEIYGFEADLAVLDLIFEFFLDLDFPEIQDDEDFLLIISNIWLFVGLYYFGIKL